MLSRLNSSSWMEDLATSAAADDATAWSAAPSPSSTAHPPLLDMDPTWYLSNNAAHNNPQPLFHLDGTTSTFDSSFPLPDLFGFASGSNNNHVFNSNAAPFAPIGNSFDLGNTSKILRPLDVCPPVGAQPTLFQKRLARQGSNAFGGFEEEKRRKTVGGSSGVDILSGYEKMFDQDGSMDGNSCLNYDSDEVAHAMTGDRMMNGNGSDQGGKVTSSSGGGVGGESSKGGKNKKGLPAKNLMAERRRRKKLNDRLYMLRSVVPRISKMDRASILGDAIEYLKELLQRINDLHNELESTPSTSQLPTPTGSSFHPLTPTIPTLPSRVKEELCPSSIPSPTGQPRVEVRIREGNTVNIHMFCSRRPGLLLSTMRALDGLGIDIQQAVISCFNGFALDVFRAEQLKDGPPTLPEDIKAILLHSAGYQGAT